MNQSNRYKLPENPTLKDINWYKKQINWGELPPFYHMVAQSLGESEGIVTHGFDNAIKRIIDRRNWNLDRLGGHIDDHNIIHCPQKPKIALYQVFTERGFELHALPYARGKEIDQYIKNNNLMDFIVWDPLTMRMILRINQLHKFIAFYFEHGDQADFALILHAHKIVHQVINYMREHVEVTKVEGVSIRTFFETQEKRLAGVDQDELQLAAIRAGLIEPKK